LRAPKGLRLSEISKEVGVKAPYITRSIDNLEAKHYVEVCQDSTDARVRRAQITTTGKQFVSTTEKRVVDNLKVIFKKVSVRDLLGYVRTLDTIVSEFEKDADGVELSHMWKVPQKWHTLSKVI
jgi:DNA-binding MarR family transcriptional regulator